MIDKKYFNKTILRTSFFIVLLFTLFVAWQNDWNFAPTGITCVPNKINIPEGWNLSSECENPYYNAKGFVCKSNKGLCDKEKLSVGEFLGTKPKGLAKLYNLISFIILATGFLINHLYWRNNGKNNNKIKK